MLLAIGFFGILFLFVLYLVFKWLRNRGRFPRNLFLEINKGKKKSEEVIERTMNKSLYDSEEELKEEYDIVVIGSGVSASVSGGILSRSGKRVLLLEKHDRLGGYGHKFDEGEYDFCAGIHYLCRLGQPLLRNLYKLVSDDTFEFVEADMLEEYNIGGTEVSIKSGSFENYKQALLDRFPEEKEALEKYLAIVEMNEDSLLKFMVTRSVPWYIKILLKAIRFDKGFHKYGPKNSRDVLDECGVKNEALRFILLAVQAIYNTNGDDYCCFPVQAVITKIYNRKFMAVGGGGRLTQSILTQMKNNSVAMCNAEVKKILRRKDGSVLGVELATGQKVHCNTVISSCGLQNTLNMLPRGLQNKLEMGRLLKKHGLYNGKLFSIFVGCDKSFADLGLEGVGCYVWSGTTRWDNFSRMMELNPPEFDEFEDHGFVYVVNMDQYDPEFREQFPEKAKMTIFTLLNDEWFRKFEGSRTKNRGSDYEEIKEGYVDKIMEVVYARFPKLEGNIDVLEAGTNLTTHDYGFWPEGSCYGLTLTYEKLFDFIGNDEVINPIKGLYMVGQDVLGPGCSLASLSSLFACTKILGRNLFKDARDAEKVLEKKE